MIYTKERIENEIYKKSKRSKIFHIIIYIIIIPIIIYNISLIVQSAVNSNKTPTFFGIKTFIIISGSMEPELNIGDIVIVKEVEKGEMEKGDIISFRSGRNVITHRVEEITKDGYKTKGDNNNTVDLDTIKYEEIDGIVVKKIPYLGNLVMFLQNKIVIIVIAIMFYIMYFYNVKQEKKMKNRKIKRIEYEKNLNK